MAGFRAASTRRGPREGRPWRALILTIAGAAALGALVLWVEPVRDAVGDAVSGDTDSLREDLRGLGIGGVGILYAVVAVHTFVWYPAEIVDAAAGFVYGFWLALALLMVAWTAQGALAYAIGRRAARPFLYRWVGQERFERLERVVDSGGATLLLAARLVPIVPFSLFSYVAGAARVPVGRFLWTTAVGYFPITALSIYFGTQLEEFSISDPLVWVSVVVLIVLLLLTSRLKPLLAEKEKSDSR
ncbi:hypothetical protein BH24ACT23_BH24ACT23_08390 [soil metagenome]